MPRIDARGVKVAEHSGGALVSDPTQLDRQEKEEDRRRTADFIAAHLPDLTTEPHDHAACMYTMSPDEHFIVDRHPECVDVVFAAGLSGHGFKFAPVLGAALVDLALEGGSSLQIEFLSLNRFRS
jgi:glycine/D-amino acid oxidase-like deaminating enzyme